MDVCRWRAYSRDTTCPSDTTGEGSTDPVGFTLTLVDGGFRVLSDGDTTPLMCRLATPDAVDPGSFTCSPTSSQETIEEDDFEVTLQIDTSSEGFFGTDSLMQTIFTVNFACVDADHPLFDISCSDVEQEANLPCVLQFSANATLDGSETSDTE